MCDVTKLIADVVADANQRVEQIRSRAELLKKLEAVGIEPGYTEGVLKYGYDIKVDRAQLGKVREVVGRLTMIGKDTAWDFERTNEIVVTLKPVNENCPLRFSYRTKYRKGGKCRVVESVSPATVYKSLVCDR